jgi:hypothetical protein
MGDVWWCAMSQTVNLGEATGFLCCPAQDEVYRFVFGSPGSCRQISFRVTFSMGQIVRPQKHRFLTMFSICVGSNHLIISDDWGTKFWPIPNSSQFSILIQMIEYWWMVEKSFILGISASICWLWKVRHGSPPRLSC